MINLDLQLIYKSNVLVKKKTNPIFINYFQLLLYYSYLFKLHIAFTVGLKNYETFFISNKIDNTINFKKSIVVLYKTYNNIYMVLHGDLITVITCYPFDILKFFSITIITRTPRYNYLLCISLNVQRNVGLIFDDMIIRKQYLIIRIRKTLFFFFLIIYLFTTKIPFDRINIFQISPVCFSIKIPLIDHMDFGSLDQIDHPIFGHIIPTPCGPVKYALASCPLFKPLSLAAI